MGIYKDGERLDGGGGGMSPYDYAVQGGFTGTEEQFLAQLNGGPYLPLAGGIVSGYLTVNGVFSAGNFNYLSRGFDWDGKAKPKISIFCKTNASRNGIWNYFQFEDGRMATVGGPDIPTLISGVAEPEKNTDAANKGYVDSAIQTAVAGLARAKIATGSYAGTGKFGATSPTVIDCGFKPKFLLCTALTTLAFSMLDVSSSNRSKFTDTLFWVEGMSIAYIPAQNGSNKGEVPMTITQTDTGISFYVTQGSFQIFGNTQLNANNTTYFWLALG